jgi:hypothetical protein
MRHLLAVLTLAALTGTAFSQEPRKEPVRKPENQENHLKTIKSPIRAAITFANWEYYTNMTIPANGSIFLDSGTDYSSANTLQITVRSTGSDIASLAIAPTWSVPGAPSYNVGTVAVGSDFFFNNTGGASFAVAGKQLRTFLYNTGPTTMTLSSVIVYTTSQ